MALAIVFAPAASAHTRTVTLHTSASEPFAAYVAGPENAARGVILVHDWFGTSPFYSAAIEKLAGKGYRVVAVDLYSGRHATTHDGAAALLSSIKDDVVARELDAAIGSLEQPGRRIAVMGFSMGARHALTAASRNHSVRATVLWYGETVNDPQTLHLLNGPALLVVGSRDGPSAADRSLAFSKAADAAGPGAEVYVYPGADHAFAQPLFNQGRTYDPVAAAVAWEVTESFLSRRL